VKRRLPRLQFDHALIVAEWRTRFASEWNPATERYVTEALEKSFENDAFYVNRVSGLPSRYVLADLLRLLKEYSKLTPPTERAGNWYLFSGADGNESPNSA
jgi:hypothetical protein